MKVEIIKPETWTKYDPKNCQTCTAGCCTLPLKVDAEDLFHMGYLQAHQVNGPLKKIAEKFKKIGLVRSYNDKQRIFTIQRKRNHDCIFLDENRRCKIYERRPSVCRKFPENSVRPNYCPYIRKLL